MFKKLLSILFATKEEKQEECSLYSSSNYYDATCPRSSRWASVREAHLLVQPNCQVCGASEAQCRSKGVHLNVHHIKPYHLHPEDELDPSNLITLCEGGHDTNCHLMWGHLGCFRSINKDGEKR